MRSGVAPFKTHQALLEHDRSHGEGVAHLGERFHWLRSWLYKRDRQWSQADWLVCGANPVLGALSAAGLARAGQSVLWICSDGFDAWDYPLTMRGAHDDLLREAGLHAMGPGLFAELASQCHGRLTRAWGWQVDYVFNSGRLAGSALAFASPSQEGAELGAARGLARKNMIEAFGAVKAWEPKADPKAPQGRLRQQIIEHRRAVWTSDELDGVERNQERAPLEALGAGAGADGSGALRLGRARWHAQTPLEFAANSREDIKLALRAGGWR